MSACGEFSLDWNMRMLNGIVKNWNQLQWLLLMYVYLSLFLSVLAHHPSDPQYANFCPSLMYLASPTPITPNWTQGSFVAIRTLIGGNSVLRVRKDQEEANTERPGRCDRFGTQAWNKIYFKFPSNFQQIYKYIISLKTIFEKSCIISTNISIHQLGQELGRAGQQPTPTHLHSSMIWRMFKNRSRKKAITCPVLSFAKQ